MCFLSITSARRSLSSNVINSAWISFCVQYAATFSLTNSRISLSSSHNAILNIIPPQIFVVVCNILYFWSRIVNGFERFVDLPLCQNQEVTVKIRRLAAQILHSWYSHILNICYKPSNCLFNVQHTRSLIQGSQRHCLSHYTAPTATIS